MSPQKHLLAWALAAGLTLVATPARAASISYAGIPNASVVLLQGSLYKGAAWAGEINWVFDGPAPSGFDQSFYAYCVDLTRSLAPTQSIEIGTSSGLTGGHYVSNAGERAAWLVNAFASTIHTSGLALHAAALQVAIWESLYDNDLDLSQGKVILATTGTILNQATTYLAALSSAGAAIAGSSATVLFTNYGQHQIINSVPEPSTILLLLAGGVFMFWTARKRRVASIV